MNGFLLDTNVISEVITRRPEERVLQFIEALPRDQVYLSAITIAELWQGIVRLPQSKRRRQLSDWMNDVLLPVYRSRILSVDLDTSFIWGDMTARLFVRGESIAFSDALIAATAKQHELTMVSRNVKHFERTGVVLLDPWTDSPPPTPTAP